MKLLAKTWLCIIASAIVSALGLFCWEFYKEATEQDWQYIEISLGLIVIACFTFWALIVYFD